MLAKTTPEPPAPHMPRGEPPETAVPEGAAPPPPPGKPRRVQLYVRRSQNASLKISLGLPLFGRIRRYDVCHARAGDKGNAANVSLVAYDAWAPRFDPCGKQH